MTLEFLELLGNVTRTGFRLNVLRSTARTDSTGNNDIDAAAQQVADLLDEAYDAVFKAQLILENEKESE